MTESEFARLKASKQIEQVKPQSTQGEQITPPLKTDLNPYLAALTVLQRPKRHLTTAPTFVPRSFAEQIQFYDDGAARRIYVYVNATWRYVALT